MLQLMTGGTFAIRDFILPRNRRDSRKITDCKEMKTIGAALRHYLMTRMRGCCADPNILRWSNLTKPRAKIYFLLLILFPFGVTVASKTSFALFLFFCYAKLFVQHAISSF